MNKKTQTPIFIYGILRRSGTNYLNQIILNDSTCEQPSSRIRENWFLHHSNSLFQYSDRLLNIYSNPKWGGQSFSEEELLFRIGNSMIEFLQSHISKSDKKLVTKTPSVNNMKFLEQLFPNVKNIIIIRNPLDVAASTYNSWKVNVNETLDNWNDGCISIYEYEKQSNSNYILIRYEDLINDLQKTFTPCIEFLGLNPDVFDWNKLDKLPIYGSGDSGPDWKVSKKEQSFQAIHKWKNLPKDQLDLLKKSYKTEYGKYFGYLGFEEENYQTQLPELKNRLKIGGYLPKKRNEKLEKSTNERFNQFKKGIKLILKSVLNK